MKSPRFTDRRVMLRRTIDEWRIKATCKNKVRGFLSRQFVVDPVGHLDVHLEIDEIAVALAKQIADGDYQGYRPIRTLMEMSKGLCRQLVIPHPYDLFVLQCLSDAL